MANVLGNAFENKVTRPPEPSNALPPGACACQCPVGFHPSQAAKGWPLGGRLRCRHRRAPLADADTADNAASTCRLLHAL